MRRIFSVAAVALMLLACGGSAAPVRVQVQVNRVVEESIIEAEFQARSTPGNPQFRKHLTEEQLTKLVRGRPESIAATADYLRRIGATHVSTFRTEDYVTATVEQGSAAAKALGIAEASFAGSKRAAVPVPHELKAHAQRVLVVPSKRAARKTKKLAHAAESASSSTSGQQPPSSQSGSGSAVTGFPGAVQTPLTIRERYNVPSTTLDPSNVQGVAEFQSSYFSLQWISTFANAFNISNNELNLNVNGPNTASTDDQEGVLDLEYIIGLAPGATTWWISSNDTSTVSPGNIDFAWWCDEVLGLKPRPSVTSVSWGLGETEYDTAVDLMFSDNDAFRKLGLVGVSVMVASGDSGPGSRRDVTCSRFNPSWPASSPYVTAVGANYVAPNGTEAAVFFSGGGFSDVFARPAYQSKAVEKYFTANAGQLPTASFYNSTGRGFPDVSTVGTNFRVYGDNGEGVIGWTWLSGTSCASPTFAAIITRVNAERAKAGKSSLGFLNPALYQLGNIGTDIVVGANQDQDCFGFDFGGFATAPGWDPVSGLGSPKYDVLLKGL